MVNVLKECDYHQSDERKGMRVSKKKEKKSAHIAHKSSNWRYVYGCNAIYAHLCTGGGDTYFSCVPFTQNVHYNITESTNNWDFLTLFFFSFTLLLWRRRLLLLQLWLCAVVCFRFTLSHCVHTFLFSNIGNILKYSRSLQCALTNQLAYFYRAAFSFFAFRWTMLFAVVVAVVVVDAPLSTFHMRLCVLYAVLLLLLCFLALEFIVSFCSCAQTYFCNSTLKRDKRLIYICIYERSHQTPQVDR